MTEETRSAIPDRAAEQAASWFVRLQDAAATGDDWLAFEAWLQAAPGHAEAYDRAERLWVELDQDRAAIIQALDPPAAVAGERRRRPGRRQDGISRRGWLVAAAALAASVVVGVNVGNRLQPPPPFETYTASPGETRRFTLADGTHIHLNSGSTIRISLRRRERLVEMADAEAVFDVAHDPDRPFLITAGDRQVRVVGTEFNLRHRDDKVVLTVRRGVVEVRPAAAPDAAATRVTVGQQLTHTDGDAPAVLSEPGPDAAFAWTTGQLIYQQQPLAEVAADLSRRFAKPVRLSDPALGRVPFSGVLVTDNEADVVRRLEAFAPVRAEETGEAITLYRRGGASGN